MHKMLSCLISKTRDKSLEIKNIVFSVNGVCREFHIELVDFKNMNVHVV